MALVLSKYSYLFEREGNFFLYAPLSNSFAEIDRETYDCLLAAQKGTACLHNMDAEVEEVLRKMKVVGVNDELEINKLKAVDVLTNEYRMKKQADHKTPVHYLKNTPMIF